MVEFDTSTLIQYNALRASEFYTLTCGSFSPDGGEVPVLMRLKHSVPEEVIPLLTPKVPDLHF